MNHLLRTLLCCAVALTAGMFASAQDSTIGQGVEWAPVPPSAPIFTNCGNGCTDFSTINGYYLSGSGIQNYSVQTVAMGFKTKGKTNFAKVLTPNTVYTANGGASNAKMSAYLMAGTDKFPFIPTHPLSKLVYKGKIPDFPKLRIVTYAAPKGKRIPLKARTLYFVCQAAVHSNDQLLWMVPNIRDITSPFCYQQQTNSCVSRSWLNLTGSTDGAAFEIN